MPADNFTTALEDLFGEVVPVVTSSPGKPSAIEYLPAGIAVWYCSSDNPATGVDFNSARILWDHVSARQWDMSI